MLAHHHVAWRSIEAERAFGKAKRARRNRRLLRRAADLDVHDERTLARRSGGGATVREIPVDAIVGTFDPGRATQFDRAFGPVERTRRRWLSVWMADDLPPISVMRVGNAYALLDGHHRVSVAIARGATTIPAVVS
jgi:hypothetical protein